MPLRTLLVVACLAVALGAWAGWCLTTERTEQAARPRADAASWRASGLALPGDRFLAGAVSQATDGTERVWIVERPGSKYRLVRIEARAAGWVELRADRLLVQLASDRSAAGLARWLQRHDARLLQPAIRAGLYHVAFDGRRPESLPRLQRALTAHPAVADVDRDHLTRFSADQRIPADSHFAEQWSLHNTGQTIGTDASGTADADIDAPEAWALTTGSPELVVAVVDNGIMVDHVELDGRMWTNPGERVAGVDDDGNGYLDDRHGFNFYTNTGDLNGGPHGSHVAGIIGAAEGNLNANGDPRGLVGVDWQVRLLGATFGGGEDGTVSGSSADAIRALDYLAQLRQRGVPIVASNHSYGFRSWEAGDLDALRAAYARQGELGMLVVTSAGNDSRSLEDLPQYPASFDLDCIITVGATGLDDEALAFANTSPTQVDLAAPGDQIFSAYPNPDWSTPETKATWLSGTSMATPMVTGAVSLLASYAPAGTSSATIKQAILDGVDPLAALDGLCLTGGRLNLHRSLLQLPGGGAGGPYITGLTPTQVADQALDEIRIRFSTAMDASSFDPAKDLLAFDGPDGSDQRSTVQTVDWPDDRTLRLRLQPRRATGTYRLRLGAAIEDGLGRALDQDLDGIPGGIDDGFSSSIALSGSAWPRVVGSELVADDDRVSGIELRFSEAMDPASWQQDQLIELADPVGRDLRPALGGIGWSDANRLLRLELTEQDRVGHYSLVLAPGLQAAVDGVAVDQDRDGQPGEDPGDRFDAAHFFDPAHQPDGFGYIALAHPLEDLSLSADDPSVSSADLLDEVLYDDGLDLGDHLLRFYGNELSGGGRVFAGTAGLLSINSAYTFGESTGFSVQPFNSQPQQAAIAPLWADWGDAGWDTQADDNPARHLLSRFDDRDGDASIDRWIVQWTFRQREKTDLLRFQLSADLNPPADCASTLIFNYPDLAVGDPAVDEGAWAVVGIKNVQSAADERLLISDQRNDHPWVQSGSAIRILVPSSLAGSLWRDDNGDGQRDPGEAGLADLRVYLDADGDGAYDPGETATTSDADGWWILPHLAWGDYQVRAESPAELHLGSPASGRHLVSLVSDEKRSGLDFAFVTDAAAPMRRILLRDHADHRWILEADPAIGFRQGASWWFEELAPSVDHQFHQVEHNDG